MLRGYDFGELMSTGFATAAVASIPDLLPFVPPLIVEWSRPIAHIQRPSELLVLPTFAFAASEASRAPEPFIGGSSRSHDEAFASEEADFSRQADAGADENDAAFAVIEVAERINLKRRRAARDLAFESEGNARGKSAEAKPPENYDQPVTDDSGMPIDQIAAKPAA
jgi:hypothetical protein